MANDLRRTRWILANTRVQQHAMGQHIGPLDRLPPPLSTAEEDENEVADTSTVTQWMNTWGWPPDIYPTHCAILHFLVHDGITPRTSMRDWIAAAAATVDDPDDPWKLARAILMVLGWMESQPPPGAVLSVPTVLPANRPPPHQDVTASRSARAVEWARPRTSFGGTRVAAPG